MTFGPKITTKGEDTIRKLLAAGAVIATFALRNRRTPNECPVHISGGGISGSQRAHVRANADPISGEAPRKPGSAAPFRVRIRVVPISSALITGLVALDPVVPPTIIIDNVSNAPRSPPPSGCSAPPSWCPGVAERARRSSRLGHVEDVATPPRPTAAAGRSRCASPARAACARWPAPARRPRRTCAPCARSSA